MEIATLNLPLLNLEFLAMCSSAVAYMAALMVEAIRRMYPGDSLARQRQYLLLRLLRRNRLHIRRRMH